MSSKALFGRASKKKFTIAKAPDFDRVDEKDLIKH